MRERQLSLFCLREHDFDLRFGWATCITCGFLQWFNPYGWDEWKAGEISFEKMQQMNDRPAESYANNNYQRPPPPRRVGNFMKKEICPHEVLVPTEFGAECQSCGEYPYNE